MPNGLSSSLNGISPSGNGPLTSTSDLLFYDLYGSLLDRCFVFSLRRPLSDPDFLYHRWNDYHSSIQVHISSQFKCSSHIYDLLYPRILNFQIVGWGFDGTGTLSRSLRQATMPIVSEATCLRSHIFFYDAALNENNFCAGYHNGIHHYQHYELNDVFFEITGYRQVEVWEHRNKGTSRIQWIRNLLSK